LLLKFAWNQAVGGFVSTFVVINQAQSGGETMHLLALFFPPVFGFGFLLYFLPTILAFARSKRDAGAILVLNFFLGWTAIGWVIALVWALKQDVPVVIR
jgi:Superinfection immunity protein